MTFVLAHPRDGVSDVETCRQIEDRTGLMALTQNQFFWKTINYFLGSTGIPVNFGITIALGFLVGAAITGQTFYLFTVENLKQFGQAEALFRSCTALRPNDPVAFNNRGTVLNAERRWKEAEQVDYFLVPG